MASLFQKKITIDNAEFVTWKTRISMLMTAVKQLKDANVKVHNAFVTMSTDMSKFSEVFENSYPEEDDFRKLTRKVKSGSTAYADRTKTNTPRVQYLTEYENLLKQIEADYVKVQKASDTAQAAAKAKEKQLTAKTPDQTKIAAAEAHAESTKNDYERALDGIIQRMKDADAKKEKVFATMLAANGIMLERQSKEGRADVQLALNFATSGKSELLGLDIEQYKEEEGLKTKVPDVEQKPEVLALAPDNSWIRADNVWCK
eukprot:CAMPEP_0185852588 /NCGR_PEP_ID=MMETSP1354-20130828/15445_1 /TAXON_ID=708628 /ORGANISM="Erythrolobus madagascarensis, Strain CCMP3276" /LENGTH=258 /DNA_ID=CAMNT_0028553875 /DNA_START=72 /DNA_END=848 /DNA_ORIENTATION=+